MNKIATEDISLDSDIVDSLKNEAAAITETKATDTSSEASNDFSLQTKSSAVESVTQSVNISDNAATTSPNNNQSDLPYQADVIMTAQNTDGSAAVIPESNQTQINNSLPSENKSAASKLSDLDVLVDSLQILTDSAKANSSPVKGQYKDKLKSIITPEEVSSEIIDSSAEALNTQSSFNQIIENNSSDNLQDRIKLAREAGNYIRRIYMICYDYRNKELQNNNSYSSDNPIEGISAIVSGLSRNPSDAEVSSVQDSNDISSSISKLPSFDEIKNNPSSVKTEDKSADTDNLSADELLRMAQEQAKAQLLVDLEKNNNLLAEAGRINSGISSKDLDKLSDNQENNQTLSQDDFLNKAYDQMAASDVVTAEDEALSVDIIAADKTAETNQSIKSEAIADASLAITSELYTSEEPTESTDSTKNCISETDCQSIDVVEGVLFDDESPKAKSTAVKLKFSMDLSEAIALSLKKASDYKNTIPVIKAKYSSPDLDKAIRDSLDTGSPADNSPKSDSLSDTSSQQVSMKNENAVTGRADNLSLDNYDGDVDFAEQNDTKDSYIDDPDYDPDDQSYGASKEVTVYQEKSVDQSFLPDQNHDMLIKDGDPRKLKESTLKLLEEDQQYENRKLGRRLEPRDFYDRVLKHDAWYQDIIKAGYTEGPVYASLCFSSRVVAEDPYSWILKISSDFELLTRSPEFHHNLRTKFSITIGHPVNITLETVKGIPSGSPEDMARIFYLKEIEDARNRIVQNTKLRELLEHLGEDVRTLNISLYKQER
ncbi:MAG: hypothetical protein ACI4ND_01800 [Succinivibrio sp.]